MQSSINFFYKDHDFELFNTDQLTLSLKANFFDKNISFPTIISLLTIKRKLGFFFGPKTIQWKSVL